MTDQEANKIIAEFMGYKYIETYTHEIIKEPLLVLEKDLEIYHKPCFTDSLDALVPVWKKLVDLPFFDMLMSGDVVKYGANFKAFKELIERNQGHSGWHDTIQQAAAHATAKAINELQEK